MRTIAHRGFAGIAPENTLAAASLATEYGADGIEFDVRATADGTPVVFHDDRLDGENGSRGITDRTGAVAASSTEHVTRARVLDTDERVPTLAAFVEAVPASVELHAELKRPGSGDLVAGPLAPARRAERSAAWTPFVERVSSALDDREAVFSSFYEGALAAVGENDPDATLAPLAFDVESAVAMAEALDATLIHPSIDGLGGGAPDGYTVNAWTARTWQDARDTRRAGADGLIADYPGLGPYDG